MSCFGGRVSQDLYQNCCNANVLCEFNGDLSNVVSEPIYVQKVYDAVLFNLQGMKTVQNQSFTPRIPQGHRVCLLYTSPSPRDGKLSRMPSSA